MSKIPSFTSKELVKLLKQKGNLDNSVSEWRYAECPL